MLAVVMALSAELAWAGAVPPAYAPKDKSTEERSKAAFSTYILETHHRGAGPFAASAPPLEVQRSAWGFRFAADEGCRDSRDDKRFCALAEPKRWTEPEIEQMGRLLNG